jgi:uncharacterized RDD family membrane protein YckC
VPARPAPEGYRGAAALAAAVAPAAIREATPVPIEQPPAWRTRAPRQSQLFSESEAKVLQFPSANKPSEPKPRARRHSPPPNDSQAFLDFLPPAPHVPRTLKTSVEAVIYCDAPVATPAHRAVGFALDFAIVVMGIGAFLLSFYLCGGEMGKMNAYTELGFAGAFACIAIFYGFLWTLAGVESAGARSVGLRLINFDGSSIDRRERATRFGCACLSFLSAGPGVLWSLADEESLTWHDHMSKTFPTIRS